MMRNNYRLRLRQCQLLRQSLRPVFLILLGLFFFISCTTDITLTVKQDDSVDISFEGGAGDAFTKMLLSASGGDAASGMQAINSDEISYELAKSGFDGVKVVTRESSVKISMTDKKRSSYIFKSGIAKYEGGKLSVNLTRRNLEDFYNSSDEQTRMILDLFLAPVFNDENMSESEYLEMLASFYGKPAAKEVETSFVNIKLIGKDGKEEKKRLPMAQLLCGIF